MAKKCIHAFLATVFCWTAALAAAQTYTITDLGPLSPTAINTWGQVVGNYNHHAFLWSRAFGLQDLGTLRGGTFSQAAAINDLGVVAGTADGKGTVVSPWPSEDNVECSDLTQPFIWTPRGGMRGLGTVGVFVDLVWCYIPFYATGINGRGQIIGYHDEAGSYQSAFLWTKAAGMTLMGDNWPPTFAYDISNSQAIAGIDSSGWRCPGHAALWKNGLEIDLGTLSGADPERLSGSTANGVNDRGQVVGGSSTGHYWDSPFHAVLWTSGGAIRDLGTLPGDIFSVASKINLFGQVVGSSGNQMTWENCGFGEGGAAVQVTGRPFVWSVANGMKDLNTVIPKNSSWVLQSVTDINFWGQIVGQGTRNGQPHGFLLTPRFFQ